MIVRGPLGPQYGHTTGFAGGKVIDGMVQHLYDLVFDPHEANNLVASTSHSEILENMRMRLQEWMESTVDPLAEGVIPEPPAKQGKSDSRDKKYYARTLGDPGKRSEV